MSPTALKMAVIFAKRMAASESATRVKEASAEVGWITQNSPIPISIKAETKLAQTPVRICRGNDRSSGFLKDVDSINDVYNSPQIMHQAMEST